ncbi:putative uncharacterized protein DDB_G0282499 [Condylostylus longicornis]|uniref:putative uncharacterized protein DDB_G0282499 n=1 Tax=Condylostylus longicornis TaxID=2530218 RepID=UPI00244E4377|nr:putative uncharacterized protein DDB_G0282499 [Condylostylus longicornis]
MMNENGKNLAEKAMDLSLDEYIKQSNIYVSPMLKQPKIESNNSNKTQKNNLRNGANKFTESDEIEEMEEDFLCIQDDDMFLEKNIDLREKLNGNSTSDNNLPKAKSASWRLMHPNVTTENRPAGMAPLIPTEILNGLELYKSNQRKNIVQENFYAKPEFSYQNNHKYYNQNVYKRIYQNRRQNHLSYNNHYRNTSQNFNNMYQKNNSIPYNNYNRQHPNNNQNRTLNGLSCNFRRMIDGNYAKEINVQSDVTKNNTCFNENLQNVQSTMLKPQHPPIVYDPSPAELFLKNGLNVLNNLSGNNGIPQIASKLLEIIGTSSKPEPKYDMKIQKEIHALQNKPMIYRCPDGEVISSDGPGIRDVPVKPSSTGITLNQRFA